MKAVSTMTPEEIERWEKDVLAGRYAGGKAPHGSPSMYQYHRCRCEVCNGAHAALARAYRARKKAQAGG